MPTSSPASLPTWLPFGRIEGLICESSHLWNCQDAIGVAACESGRDVNGYLDGDWATNGHVYGVFQLHDIHLDRWPDMFDVIDGLPNWARATWNVEHAYDLWNDTNDWRHWAWVCRP